MRKPPGNHTARRASARAEPSPVTALRELFCRGFGADVSAISPLVCDVLRDEITITASAPEREVRREALVRLARRAMQVGDAAAIALRRRFEAGMTAVVGDRDRDPLLERLAASASARLDEQNGAQVRALREQLCGLVSCDLHDAGAVVAPRELVAALLEGLEAEGFEGGALVAAFRAYGPALLYIGPDLYQHANTLLFERGATTAARDERSALLERLLAGRTRPAP